MLIRNLQQIYVSRWKSSHNFLTFTKLKRPRNCSTNTQTGETRITIGDVSVTVKPPKRPEAVPTGYLPSTISQSLLQNLKWMIQKDLLGQDMFLLGNPGSSRRILALQTLELLQREMEYVALSRDTTESDLKQRREIAGGTSHYIDQSAVRAAMEGRVLILEGIEKAERNVLPVLNNLLENREMQLEDGRLLIRADRYDKLIKEHGEEALKDWKLVRVSEDFRVIALGLPVPRYKGNLLDPPLRSRFQGRNIMLKPYKELLEELKTIGNNVPHENLSQMLSFVYTLLSADATTIKLPDFPVDNLPHLVHIMNEFPYAQPNDLLQRLYPFRTFLGKDGQKSVVEALNLSGLSTKEEKKKTKVETFGTSTTDPVVLNHGRSKYSIQVPIGSNKRENVQNGFECMDYHQGLLAEMIQSHSVKDFCLIGPRGCGKTQLVRHLARCLGYPVEIVMCYQDMSIRDLVQQRMTLPNGDTCWRLSPLIQAALKGRLAVLDGIQHLHSSTLAALHRLISDREFQLYDGQRLFHHERYETIKSKLGLTDEELTNRGILRIHPSFRIVALAEPPTVGSSPKGQWLGAEALSTFLFHVLRPLSAKEEQQLLSSQYPGVPAGKMDVILKFAQKLRSSDDPMTKSLASSLSTRQLMRIGKFLSQHPDSDVGDILHKACLSRFLPPLAKRTLDSELESSSISTSDSLTEKEVSCEIKDGFLRIGDQQVSVHNPGDASVKVPEILFFDNPQQSAVLESLLKNFMLGEHLLLVGNQGVGKNKLVDKFLQMLQRPREYIQLHRDTSVPTLTLQPTLRDGKIVYEDSPLVRAVQNGHILVVDEADKAPTHVTCVLKSLLEAGEMTLGDGRKIVNHRDAHLKSENIIVMHPDFRMIVLANRPGFPFLGNDFFGALGDLFSCHAIDNPSFESELSLLKQYGPSVPEHLLLKLVQAFSELRSQSDQGLLAYPFSTREVVNIVRHLEEFPSDGITSVVRNIFDFDAYSKETREVVAQVLQKNGIPFGTENTQVKLNKQFPLPQPVKISKWEIYQDETGSKIQKPTPCAHKARTLKLQGPVQHPVNFHALDKTESRSVYFSEEQYHWSLPLGAVSQVIDIAVTQEGDILNDRIHVLTSNPMMLYNMSLNNRTMNSINLQENFPTSSSTFKPRTTLSVIQNNTSKGLLLHEEMTNTALLIDPENGHVSQLLTDGGLIASTTAKLTRLKKDSKQFLSVAPQTSQFGEILLFKNHGEDIELVDISTGKTMLVNLPVLISAVHTLSKNSWMVESADKRYLLERSMTDANALFELRKVHEDPKVSQTLCSMSCKPLSPELLSSWVGHKMEAPNRFMASLNDYGSMLVGLPDLQSGVEVYNLPRLPEDPWLKVDSRAKQQAASPSTSTCVLLADSGQIVRTWPPWVLPAQYVPEVGKDARRLSGYLEVVDLANFSLTYIPVHGSSMPTPGYSWQYGHTLQNSLLVAKGSKETLVTVDREGCLRTWETSLTALENSLYQWKKLIGQEDKPLQLTIEQTNKKEATMPKHGKVDQTGAPHVGGNTWAGGTGGRDTAGLGGVGGPYRLDAGHNVFQVSQADKDAVPEHVRRAAAEMGKKAFADRLKEIRMSEHDADLYQKFSASVSRQVQLLKVILDSMQVKGKERHWLKHQALGELDDSKLIEGLTGEKTIYRRRGEKEPEIGSTQEKPKRIRLVVDVSGSMYRFNSYDGRLEREMETVLMVMEALQGYQDKIKYDIFGHSGEEYNIPLVDKDKPPMNDRERLEVLKTMHAHSQFCMSGDNTLPGFQSAIQSISEEEADEHFVIGLSDANLDRYGIPVHNFANILNANPEVNSFTIFLGSLGDQAQRLLERLPAGKSFVCLDTKELPQILQQIFTSSIFKS